ncbi:MBL fold metallo-hydrolase [Methylorubrum rhodesianum]|jgi:glyoxylase-like metal-dependent hydrolase (beta-lactamase superfamily II)|uniref:MBL fold metallo-hydrolase n=1 Tax=Methylorubrum rhodesianum TaxID=29427 RepID=A0ABU9ZDG8_9HYPH|nr:MULTISPECIES: MBL fold metallo-hydrolase [Methylorubrum]MBB5761032.1 glyoxylase-like metal-dependent hydrolase (beta-lactamase superfamily II) [Methylorubrum rhodesianum]MBI1687851.1 MBL fold metallo-hydrolase [Methylorubrum sp. DB1722]MBK3404636.1 MBL fold metallo-hydrolase [Methylorubrum rhodesianum]MBY0140611.1 MBL fold metallo-hydrolase [Methylorubrum populi]
MSEPSTEAQAPSPGFESALPAPERTETMSPLVRRRICPNGGPFTASGTCTYVVGRRHVAVIDPGPADAGHIEGLLASLAGEQVDAIVVTHTHRDHSPGARLLQARTGAPIVGCGPHRAARELAENELPALDASADRAHRPDRELRDGESLTGDGWTLTAVATPGHTMNHLAFALPEENVLFSGDHVMAWSTSIVAPPDGSMRAYMESLERLRERDETLYWPGHGGPVRDPRRFVRGLAAHRRQREAAIRARLDAGDRDIAAIVRTVYQGLAPHLRGAAALSVFAHLEDLVERGLAITDGPPLLDGTFRPA